MRRKIRLCLAAAVIALGPTSATAQLIHSLPLKKGPVADLQVQQKLNKVSGRLVAPVLKDPVGTVRTTVTPLLGATLKPVQKIISTVGTPLGSSQPVSSPPLLAPSLARTDVTLNRVSPLVAAPRMLSAPAVPHIAQPAPLQRSAASLLVEPDPAGQLIARGRILLIDPPAQALKRVRARGFSVVERRYDPELGFGVVTLAVPRGLSAIDAMRRLRSLAPGQTADFDHLYEPAGGKLAPSTTRAASSGATSATLIGMVDGGVASHRSLLGRVREQRGFAGPARATGHGTAIASLLVGSDGAFRGAARGASLLVADVYGGNSSAGSASRIARALSWLASRRPRVINISLVGPPNALLKRSIDSVRAKGIPVVAAVGNDGPAAAPRYPASYPSVLAVTAVDPRGAVLFESSKAIDLDFAAPGADMAAARPGKGYARVRGTSFAAALAAGRLAQLGSSDRLAAEAKPGKGRVGRGIVCSTCRVPPKAVGAH